MTNGEGCSVPDATVATVERPALPPWWDPVTVGVPTVGLREVRVNAQHLQHLAVDDTLAQEVEEDEPTPILREVDELELAELTDPETIRTLILEAVAELLGDFLVRLPLIVLAIVVFLLLLFVVRLVVSGVKRGMRRADVKFNVRQLVGNLLRIVLLLIVVLFSLTVAGDEVGAVLAALGLIGLGIALALQNILENVLSGILILIRKPYDRGEVIVTNDLEGFVEDIDLRVTTIRAYDGTLTLVPNADIFNQPLTNLTRRGTRRSSMFIGIDYRDDHVLAPQELLEAALSVENVLPDPEPAVLLVGLGDSSVDLEVRFSTLADLGTVVRARHDVLTACKTAIEEAGMTIPWPIRTLAADKTPLEVVPPGGTNGTPTAGATPLPARAEVGLQLYVTEGPLCPWRRPRSPDCSSCGGTPTVTTGASSVRPTSTTSYAPRWVGRWPCGRATTLAAAPACSAGSTPSPGRSSSTWCAGSRSAPSRTSGPTARPSPWGTRRESGSGCGSGRGWPTPTAP